MTTGIEEVLKTERGEDSRTEVEEVSRIEAGVRGRGGRVTRETAGSVMTSEAPAEVEAGVDEEAARSEITRGRRRLGSM